MSAGVVGLLFLYPTSTNRAQPVRKPGTALAAAGVVTPAAGASPAPTSSAGTTTSTVTVNGSSVDTRYGPVQVQITVQSGRVVSATAIDYPQNDGRDREINAFAIPVLQQETVSAQSAQIDTVSGATYTSDGYKKSLQAALDAAHIG